jgi:hypothetical protein
VAKAARPKGTKGQCTVCRKLLAQVSPGGLATKHADRNGDFCGGIGRPVVSVSKAGSKRAGMSHGSCPTKTKGSTLIPARRVAHLQGPWTSVRKSDRPFRRSRKHAVTGHFQAPRPGARAIGHCSAILLAKIWKPIGPGGA